MPLVVIEIILKIKPLFFPPLKANPLHRIINGVLFSICIKAQVFTSKSVISYAGDEVSPYLKSK